MSSCKTHLEIPMLQRCFTRYSHSGSSIIHITRISKLYILTPVLAGCCHIFTGLDTGYAKALPPSCGSFLWMSGHTQR